MTSRAVARDSPPMEWVMEREHYVFLMIIVENYAKLHFFPQQINSNIGLIITVKKGAWLQDKKTLNKDRKKSVISKVIVHGVSKYHLTKNIEISVHW